MGPLRKPSASTSVARLGSGQTGIATPEPELHPKKVMVSVWWNSSGIVHWELLPNGHTITAELYCQQLDRVAANLMGGLHPVYFLHDNSRPHTARLTRAKLVELGWVTLNHPPYFPDLAPTDYHLFRSLSHHLNGKVYDDEEELEFDLANFFAEKPLNFYERGIISLPLRWQEVINANGDYIADS